MRLFFPLARPVCQQLQRKLPFHFPPLLNAIISIKICISCAHYNCFRANQQFSSKEEPTNKPSKLYPYEQLLVAHVFPSGLDQWTSSNVLTTSIIQNTEPYSEETRAIKLNKWIMPPANRNNCRDLVEQAKHPGQETAARQVESRAGRRHRTRQASTERSDLGGPPGDSWPSRPHRMPASDVAGGPRS